MIIVWAIVSFLMGFVHQWLFQIPALVGLTGVLLIICIAGSILLGNSSTALRIALFSAIIGAPVSLNVMGRTPSVYWIDIVFPVAAMSIFLRMSVQKKGYATAFKFGEVAKEYWPILAYLIIIPVGLVYSAPYDSLKSLVLGYHLLLSALALVVPLHLVKSREHIVLINRLYPLMGLFLLGAFANSVYNNELGAAYLIDHAFHGSISIGWARSNFLAAFFVIFILLNISTIMVFSDRRTKALSIFAIFSLSVCILFIASIGAIISLILTVLFFLFMRQKHASAKLIISVIFLSILLFHPAVSYFSKRVLLEIERYGSGDPIRILLWQDSWKQFLMHPLVGVGLGNKGFISKANLGLYYPTTHNFILQSLAETGFAGTVLLLAFYGKYSLLSFKMAFVHPKDNEKRAYYVGTFLALMAALLHGLVEPNLSGYSYRTLLWFLIALLPVYGKILPVEPEAKPIPRSAK